MSTNTPRTDAAVFLTLGAGFKSVDPNFARQLERELTAAKSEVERLKANIAVPKESSSLPYRQQLRLAAWPLLVHFILTVIAILVFL